MQVQRGRIDMQWPWWYGLETRTTGMGMGTGTSRSHVPMTIRWVFRLLLTKSSFSLKCSEFEFPCLNLNSVTGILFMESLSVIWSPSFSRSSKMLTKMSRQRKVLISSNSHKCIFVSALWQLSKPLLKFGNRNILRHSLLYSTKQQEHPNSLPSARKVYICKTKVKNVFSTCTMIFCMFRAENQKSNWCELKIIILCTFPETLNAIRSIEFKLRHFSSDVPLWTVMVACTIDQLQLYM